MKGSDARYVCLNHLLPGLPEAGDPCWEKAAPAELLEVESGKHPFLHTEFRLLRDDSAQAFYLKITAEDDEVRSTYRMHDETLYRQDVFELFLADGGTLRQYREIEVSPFDVTFTGTINFKSEAQRVLNMDWDIPGFVTRTRFFRQDNLTVSVWKLPYAAFEQMPVPGSAWRFNVFRVDHSRRGEELQAWQTTGARNFHVPERFGWLDFIA
jgi:hypothetical protein